MNKPKKLRRKLRDRLDAGEITVLPGVYDALGAKIAEKLGFDGVSVSGMGVAHSTLGMPDLGLVSLSENVAVIRNICNAVEIAVKADMETGYGNALSVIRSTREYERAGIAALHIEDQAGTNKRCGHMRGKMVISTEEMIGKIRACVEAREDENLVIIARCDARAPLGNEEARKRAHAYFEAGADVIFMEAPTSVDEAMEDRRLIDRRIPLYFNMATGARTPPLTVSKIKEMGYSFVSFPDTLLYTTTKAIWGALSYLKENGTDQGRESNMVTFQESVDLVDFSRFKEYEERFVPPDEVLKRYGSLKVPRTV